MGNKVVIINTPVIGTSRWEDSDYIVTMDGKPIGMTLSEAQAGTVAAWFRGVCTELPTLTRDHLFGKLVEALKKLESAQIDYCVSHDSALPDTGCTFLALAEAGAEARTLLAKIKAAGEVGK